MAVQKSVVVGSVLGMLMSFNTWALDDISRKSCPTSVELNYTLSQDELKEKLSKMPELRAVTQIHHNFVESFLFEYEKFPMSLRKEMNKAGGTINLMEGKGIAEDPSWPGETHTKDGREWAKVPGGGGSIYSYPKNPTRIVINHIYERSQEYGHGSTNLVLHEHAHTLDHLYRRKTISGSPAWKKFHENPENQEIIKRVFSSYEASNELESFAEIFAYYHACPETRAHLEQVLPEAAKIIANLTHVKKSENRREQEVTNRPTETIEEAPAQPRRRFSLRKLFKDIGDGVEDLINPDNN